MMVIGLLEFKLIFLTLIIIIIIVNIILITHHYKLNQPIYVLFLHLFQHPLLIPFHLIIYILQHRQELSIILYLHLDKQLSHLLIHKHCPFRLLCQVENSMNKYANSDTGDSKVREPANSEVEYVRRLEVEIKVKHGKYCHEW